VDIFPEQQSQLRFELGELFCTRRFKRTACYFASLPQRR
jgi:hypothetical protein